MFGIKFKKKQKKKQVHIHSKQMPLKSKDQCHDKMNTF